MSSNLPRGISSQSKNSTTDSSVPHLYTRYFFLFLHCSGKRSYLYSFQRLGSSSTSEFPKCKIKLMLKGSRTFKKIPCLISCNFAETHMYTRECQTFGFAGFEVGQQLNHCSHSENSKQTCRAWELAGNLSLYFQKLMARGGGNTEAFQQHSKNNQVSHPISKTLPTSFQATAQKYPKS